MSDHEFRNKDIIQLLEFREWIRKNMPGGPDGFVVEDLDLILRIYGPNYNIDTEGEFMLIELKYNNAWIDHAQKRTFGLMNKILRRGEEGKRKNRKYKGYYIIQYTDENWDKSKFRINKVEVSREEFIKFISFDEKVMERIFIESESPLGKYGRP